MGLTKFENPARAGGDVAKYDGWFITYIIKDFRDNYDLDQEWDRTVMRRAFLVSYEAKMLIEGRRFNV